MNDRDQIVIVTQIDDPHTDEVILTLEEMGYESVRLNTDDIPTNTMMSLSLGNRARSWGGSIEILTNGRLIDVEAIRSVWWRRPAQFGLPGDLSEQEREFASGEIDAALRGLWASLDCYWVSHPDHIRRASYKVDQLRRAALLGFEVPRTLITTSPEEARAFYAACGERMVFKVLEDPSLGTTNLLRRHPDRSPEPYAAYTTLITEPELDQLEAVRLVPCLFQEYVPKEVELRVTVIGEDLFVAEVHSQADEKAATDWRHNEADIPYREATLPVEVAERCLSLVKSYQLNFSAIDLILTPDGRYVFVENNPNGQFIFVEQLVPELAMTEALAACLIRGANK